MDHLIMREGEHKVFGIGVELAECQTVMMETTVDRVLPHVGKGVIHPSHIPLHREPQPTRVGGS